jgi:splicing factor 3A subunit 2
MSSLPNAAHERGLLPRAHTQGKKHQTNLARRAARDMKEGELQVAPKQSSVQRKVFLKIGRPGYRVTKVRDRESGKEGMMVQIHLPQIKAGVIRAGGS